MNKLRLAGWAFIPVAVVAAIVGFLYQEGAGGMAKSPEARSAAGVFLACLGAAGMLLTADARRRGVINEEGQDISRNDQPTEFWTKGGSGFVFRALFLVVGLLSAIRVWIK